MKKYSIVVLFILLSAIPLKAQEEAPPPQAGPQEEPIQEELQQQNWTRSFQEAEAIFNSAEQPESIALFQQLISEITAEKMKRELSEPESLLLLRSLDYLGQGFYNEGQVDQAEAIFLKLIELDPNYVMNEQMVSPKIIEFMKKIRDESFGTMTVKSEPAGAKVKVDGKEVGTTQTGEIYVRKGDHDVEVEKPGFLPQRKVVTIVSRKTQRIDFELERSSSVAYIVTYPREVEVLLNGQRIGLTAGGPAVRAEAVATANSLPVTDFSDELAIPDLQPGIYELELRKPCWETQKFRLPIEKHDDYFLTPVALLPSNAYLDVTADEPQANIIIDENYIGIAPKQKVQICSGEHVVKIKGPGGKYEKRITVRKDETLRIEAKLRPSLAFLGLLPSPRILKSDIEGLTAETIRQLSTLQNLNFTDNTATVDRRTLDEHLGRILEESSRQKPDDDRKNRIQELSTKTESDLLLTGYIFHDGPQRSIRFYLFSNWSSVPDIRVVKSAEGDHWKEFARELDHEVSLLQKRLGVALIDTEVTDGPVISQILIQTFEESSPLKVGDILIRVQDRAVTRAAEVDSAVNQLQDQDTINVTVRRSGAELQVPLKLFNGAVEIAYDDPALLYNRLLVSFKKVLNTSNNPLEKKIADLNIALCHLHFGEYEQAIERLQQINLERETGIGQGTVLYHMAQSYRELGYIKEAQQSLAEALRHAQNTLHSDDGLLLAPEVERAQQGWANP